MTTKASKKNNPLKLLLLFLAVASIWSLLSNFQLRQRYVTLLPQVTPSQDAPPQKLDMVSSVQFQNATLPPDHCASQPPIQEIIIKGERHSGTNWVRVILENSKDDTKNITLDCDGIHIGWKHGFLPPEGWGRPFESSDLFVVVTRDVFMWLPKMHQETYDANMNRLKRNVPFHEFIKRQVVGIAHNHAHNHIKNKETSQYWKDFLLSEKVKNLTNKHGLNRPKHGKKNTHKENYIGEVAANTIQLRTDKYKNWLSDNPAVETYNGSDIQTFLNNRVHIRMEDLTNSSIHEDAAYRQLNTVIQPVSSHCVPMKAEFAPVLARTKFPTYEAKEKVHDSDVERKELLSYYSKEDLRFVLSQLDMEFEKKLGYNYDYVYELLESDDVPERLKKKKRKRKKWWFFRILSRR